MEGTTNEVSTLKVAETTIGAINLWRSAMHEAADLKRDADLAEARALVTADGKSDAIRKAQATIASAELYRRYERAHADARAMEAIVDSFVGRRRQ